MPLYGTVHEFPSQIRTEVWEQVLSDEEFIAGARIRDSLIKRFRSYLVLTDRRLIKVQRGLIRTNREAFNLDKITNVDTSTGPVAIEGSGGIDEELLIRRDSGGEWFITLLQEQIANQ